MPYVKYYKTKQKKKDRKIITEYYSRRQLEGI